MANFNLREVTSEIVKEEVCKEFYDYMINTVCTFLTLTTVEHLYERGLHKAAEKIKERLK